MAQCGLYLLARPPVAAVKEGAVDLVQDRHRVPRPLSYSGWLDASGQPHGDGCVPQIVGPLGQWAVVSAF